jgi:hypothetical protein
MPHLQQQLLRKIKTAGSRLQVQLLLLSLGVAILQLASCTLQKSTQQQQVAHALLHKQQQQQMLTLACQMIPSSSHVLQMLL